MVSRTDQLARLTGNEHALLLTGDIASVRELVHTHLHDTYNISASRSPDVWDSTYAPLSVDDVREISRIHHARSVEGNGRFFILAVTHASTEAQNALLKTLEEPAPDTRFFIITPDAEILLPTVRSRLSHIHIESREDELSSADDVRAAAQNFFTTPPADRLTVVKPLIEQNDKTEARRFLDALEAEAAQLDITAERVRSFLGELYAQKSYVRVQGGSLKLCLEHLALIAPVCSPS